MKNMKNKVFKINGHIAGIYDPDNKVFTKEVQDSKHRMRILDAWGIDIEILEKLPENTIIKIKDKEKGIEYRTTREAYFNFGEYYHFKQYYTDHNTQLFLQLKYFEKIEQSEDEKERIAYLKSQGILK